MQLMVTWSNCTLQLSLLQWNLGFGHSLGIKGGLCRFDSVVCMTAAGLQRNNSFALLQGARERPM
jgi:hypothetical protein